MFMGLLHSSCHPEADSERSQEVAKDLREGSVKSWFNFLFVIPRAYWYLAAVIIYLIISFIYFGLPVLGHITTDYIGAGTDPFSFMWWLYWWPYAVFHGLNPFITHVVWAPSGYNLAWSTGVPGLSLLVAPFTFTLGPTASYNILILFSPVLAAFTSYVLAFHLTGRFFPSLFGGFIFGFSSYELGQLIGHLNLSFTCMIPLCVFLMLLFFDDKIGWVKFIILMTLALVFQFLVSTEIFASMTVLGVVVLILAAIVFPRVREKIFSKGKIILGAYGLAAVLLSPYLYYIFAFGYPSVPINSPAVYSSDLLNLFLPTEITLLGQSQFHTITVRFSGTVLENGAYIGLPLLIIILIYFLQYWHTRTGKFLIISLVLMVLASLGPILHIGGTGTLPLPWTIFGGLPLINQALPARFIAFAFLLIAIIVALFLTGLKSNKGRQAAAYGLVLLSLITLIPNTPGGYWHNRASTPPFFPRGIYRDYIRKGETVIIIPYGYNGQSMRWQAETGMYFNMAGGYTGLTPKEFTDWPVLNTFYLGIYQPDEEAQLKDFLKSHKVEAVIIDNTAPAVFFRIFDSLGYPSQNIGGMILYQIN
jgi:hypothetical protein